ncbi:MAG: hypothetical protein ACI9CE_003533, partial [Flavobacterium sp.]
MLILIIGSEDDYKPKHKASCKLVGPYRGGIHARLY